MNLANQGVVYRTAMTFINVNGITTTSEVTNNMTRAKYWVTHQEVSDLMEGLFMRGDFDRRWNGSYWLYFLPSGDRKLLKLEATGDRYWLAYDPLTNKSARYSLTLTRSKVRSMFAKLHGLKYDDVRARKVK